jgi:hypothetical protein
VFLFSKVNVVKIVKASAMVVEKGHKSNILDECFIIIALKKNPLPKTC